MVVVGGGITADAFLCLILHHLVLVVDLGEVCCGVFRAWLHYPALIGGGVVVSSASRLTDALDHSILFAPLVIFLGHGTRRRVPLRCTRYHGGLGLVDWRDPAFVLVVAVVSVDGRVERKAAVVNSERHGTDGFLAREAGVYRRCLLVVVRGGQLVVGGLIDREADNFRLGDRVVAFGGR